MNQTVTFLARKRHVQKRGTVNEPPVGNDTMSLRELQSGILYRTCYALKFGLLV